MTLLLLLHSIFRWLVVSSLLTAILMSIYACHKKLRFNRPANQIRHWTATIAHIQLIIGMTLAFKSPYFIYFWENTEDAMLSTESVFFGLIHPVLMFIAIVILTIGSAKAKRRTTDYDKYKTIILWYSISLIIIFIAIPWPFSPLASRPLIPNLTL